MIVYIYSITSLIKYPIKLHEYLVKINQELKNSTKRAEFCNANKKI